MPTSYLTHLSTIHTLAILTHLLPLLVPPSPVPHSYHSSTHHVPSLTSLTYLSSHSYLRLTSSLPLHYHLSFLLPTSLSSLISPILPPHSPPHSCPHLNILTHPTSHLPPSPLRHQFPFSSHTSLTLPTSSTCSSSTHTHYSHTIAHHTYINTHAYTHTHIPDMRSQMLTHTCMHTHTCKYTHIPHTDSRLIHTTQYTPDLHPPHKKTHNSYTHNTVHTHAYTHITHITLYTHT